MKTPEARNDPMRADAARVYRYIRDHDAPTVVDIAKALFDAPDDAALEVSLSLSARYAIVRRGYRRVYDLIGWIRSQGVTIIAIPSPVPDGLTTFSLSRVVTERANEPSPPTGEKARSISTPEAKSDAMGLWHGKK